MATCRDEPRPAAPVGSGGVDPAPVSPRKGRSMSFRAPRHRRHSHHPRSLRSTSLSLRGGEWQPSISPSTPDAALAEEQTFAEFSLLSLRASTDTRDAGAAAGAASRGAEESLLSIAAAPKRRQEPGTPDDRPAKRRRGVAGGFVGDAVHAAYAWFSSWTHTDGAGQTNGHAAHAAPATPSAAVTRTPTRVVHPVRAVYLSNRRRRVLVPTMQRRRAAPARPAEKGAAGSCSRTPWSSRSSSPFPFSSRGGAGTPTPASSTPCAPPVSSPSKGDGVSLAAQEGSSGSDPDAAQKASSSSDPGQPDAALERMQSRLSSMITQCRTALSAPPDTQTLDLAMAEDAALFPLPSSPAQPARRVERQASISLIPTATPAPTTTAQAGVLPSTPSLFSTPVASRQRSTPTPTQTPTPTRSRGSLSGQGQTPSRIPVPISRAFPPTAATFAFQMQSRPSSRASGRAATVDSVPPVPRPVHPGIRSRPASTTPLPASPSSTSPRKLGHRASLSASVSGTAHFSGFASPPRVQSPRSPRKTGPAAYALPPPPPPPVLSSVHGHARSASQTPHSPLGARSGRSSAPLVRPSTSTSTHTTTTSIPTATGSPRPMRRQ